MSSNSSSQTTAVSATSPSLEDNNVKTPVTMTSADGVQKVNVVDIEKAGGKGIEKGEEGEDDEVKGINQGKAGETSKLEDTKGKKTLSDENKSVRHLESLSQEGSADGGDNGDLEEPKSRTRRRLGRQGKIMASLRQIYDRPSRPKPSASDLARIRTLLYDDTPEFSEDDEEEEEEAEEFDKSESK